MSTLIPCPGCGTHLKQGTCACPTCGANACGSPRSTAALVLGLALAGCAVKETPLYGVQLMDADGDGWFEGDDCDDNDETIHPDAEEIPGDGVDSNCDTFDDPQSGDTGDTGS